VGPAPAAETPAPDAGAAPDAAETPAGEAPAETPAGDTPAETEPAAGEEAASDAPDPAKVKQEVLDLNAKFAGWAFEIPDYRADALAKRMADLLKKPAEDAAELPAAEGEIPPEVQELLDQAAGGADEPAPDGDG
jgi:hypothetical protein